MNPNIKLSSFYLIGALAILNILTCNSQEKEKNAPPNIICILVDDLGYGDLSCQGATDMRTPNIDKIAAAGMTFTNFYANSTVCSPSRAALLTGKYPDMVGVPGVVRQNENNSWGHLSEESIFIPQVLGANGYDTALVGKWHLGLESPNTPNEKGFDYFKGFLGDMMDDYWTHLRQGVNWMRENEKIITPEGHATDIFTDWAIDYLIERNKKSNPFYLYLAYNAPHFPIQPPEEWLAKVKKREKGISDLRAKNVAFVEHLDYSVGRFMDTLKKLGLDDNTLVVFTSDNGGLLKIAQSNGKLRGGKQDMYEGGIRVPTFVNWKDKIEPKSKSDNFGMLMDLFPTFCTVAGADYTHQIDGINLLPTFFGEKQVTNDRYVYWMRREGEGGYGGKAYYAARYKDFKMLQNTPYEPIEYFNVGLDPYEKNPVESDDEAYGALRANLQEHIRLSGKIPWQKKE